MSSETRSHVGQLVILALLVSVLRSGCANVFTPFVLDSGYRHPEVPELDHYVVNLEGIQRTTSREDVRTILGEPPFVHEIYGDGNFQWASWWYPIRNISAVPIPGGAEAQTQVIPAVELRIWLDESARVDRWCFFHPVTNSPMEVTETIEQADSRLRKMHNPIKRIALAMILRQGTPKKYVLEGMCWLEGSVVSTEWGRSQVRILREGQQEILIYYADHPSPLYIPSYYVVVTFYAKRGTGWHFEGWGGGK